MDLRERGGGGGNLEECRDGKLVGMYCLTEGGIFN